MITPQEGYDEEDLKTLEGTLTLDTSNYNKGDIVFYIDNCIEMLNLCGDGNIYVKGKLIENDMEVVEGMREFLRLNGLCK